MAHWRTHYDSRPKTNGKAWRALAIAGAFISVWLVVVGCRMIFDGSADHPWRVAFLTALFVASAITNLRSALRSAEVAR